MRKQFRMIDLECANCAAKMEDAIQKINGVDSASMNFMAQKLTIEAAEQDFDRVLEQAVKACRKIEPDCRIAR